MAGGVVEESEDVDVKSNSHLGTQTHEQEQRLGPEQPLVAGRLLKSPPCDSMSVQLSSLHSASLTMSTNAPTYACTQYRQSV